MIKTNVFIPLQKCFKAQHYVKINTFSRRSAFLQNIRSCSQNVQKYEINKNIKLGPGLEHFIANSNIKPSTKTLEKISHPYVDVSDVSGHGRKVYFEVYGCQMNKNDIEVTWGVLQSVGYEKTTDLTEADVVLIMTCSIRDGAEKKIWDRLATLKKLKRGKNRQMKIGILGCMAERMKKDILEKEKAVDLVMGPDSYRDLPRLLAITESGDKAVNVLLSLEETYADITPVSLTENRKSAFVSIMRGCDNMCTYCIVPFTRGRERSRPISSILDEIRILSDQGVKEVTLLGQNVNSYRDTSETTHSMALVPSNQSIMSAGFNTVYKPKIGGLRFDALLEKVSELDPEMRIRFTSPHPKDFPDQVLTLISEKKNICNHIHLPAQSGNSRILEIMRRGYTREAYLDLVHHIKELIPDIALTSDFIVGFCSETDEEFEDTLTLLDAVKYSFCYIFPYSLREKTQAHRKLKDDVPEEVKLQRLYQIRDRFRKLCEERHAAQMGQLNTVLVTQNSRRSSDDFVGYNDNHIKVIVPKLEIPDFTSPEGISRIPVPGDYVEVELTSFSSQTLKGRPLAITKLQNSDETREVLLKNEVSIQRAE